MISFQDVHDRQDDSCFAEFIENNSPKLTSSYFPLELSGRYLRFNCTIVYDHSTDWFVIGWCDGADLDYLRNEEEIAVMYEHKDGRKVWFHHNKIW